LTTVYAQPSQALALTRKGDLYLSLENSGLGVMSASERSSAKAAHRAAAMSRIPVEIDGAALTADSTGRVWFALQGRPNVAFLDPTSNRIQTFTYAAPAIQAQSAVSSQQRGATQLTAQPPAVWLRHIVAMATDSNGHLWYIRDGLGQIEEVSA
jgi:streptogramin lyase